MKSSSPKPLTDRQERFVHEYLLDQNASAAAVRAGYSAKNKGTYAAQLMQDARVCARIAVELNDLFAQLKFNALELLRAQLRNAYFDPAKLFDAAQEPIPLEELDAETRAAVTVSYSRRRSGDHVTHVRQTPRHVALNILQRRLEAFEKVQREALAAARWEEEAEPARARPGIFDIKLQLDEPQPPVDMAAANAAMAQAARSLRAVEARGTVTPAERTLAEPLHEPITTPTPSLPVKERSRSGEAAMKAAAASASASTSASVPVTAPASASVSSPAQGEEGPPPSPFEPGYDFKKDPDAMYGGRFKAWNKYWREKRERELHAAEEQAALLNPPPNFRVGPGKTVPVRMEPGYNPPWLRNNRQEFAIGAGECWID